MEPDSIWAFTVQCALCSEWRITTKKEYERVRENILKLPFVCQTACGAPSDITQEVGGRVWATDKPNIPAPPPGWQRLLQVRAKQTNQFADVYYYPPLGKNKKIVKKDRLRSTREVASFLEENPRYAKKGILSRFSFTIPEPLPVLHATTTNAVANRRIILSLPSPPDQPLSGTSHNVETDLHLSSPGHSDSFGSSQLSKKKNRGRPKKRAGPSLSFDTHVPKKQKSSSIRRCSSWFKSCQFGSA